ncbi:MAG: DUF4339 domain-containing protein [Polyangiaceae bacterium]|nr:DUF4339 domain-containing protein [Polyangiaceae bacterium]
MRSIKLLAEAKFAAVGNSDRWYVSDGATAVGPVALELLARGIEEGRVPLESYVRHEAWRVWRPLSEVALVNFPPAADSAAPTPPYHGPMPEMYDATDDVTLPGRPLLPEELHPSDALEGAADMHDALHLLLNAAVLHLVVDVALLHVVGDQGAVVQYAHGPFSRSMIGTQTSFTDPVMALARAGTVIVAEPAPGPAGQALVQRLSQLGVQCEAATMHPIIVGGRLLAVLEVGRKGPQLKASELVLIERLVDTFVSRTDAGAWH